MKKDPVTLALALLLTLGGGTVQAQEQQQQAFTVQVEGQQIFFDAAPFLQDDRIFVPLRALSEALGAEVQYEPLEDVATILKGDLRLVLNFRTGEVTRNGQPFPMEPAPRFVDDRAMVPLRFVGEAFHEEVHYEETTQTITLSPTPETLDQRQAIRSVWMDSLSKMSQQSGYRMDIVGRSVQNKQVEERHSAWEYQREPFLLHGAQKEAPQYEAYIAPTEIWTRDSHKNHWIKDYFGPEYERAYLQQAGLFPLTEAEVDLMLPFAALQEQETTRVLTVRPSRYAFMKWMMSTTKEKDKLDSMSPEMLYDASANFQAASLIFTIDKSTGLFNESSSWLLRGERDADNHVRYSDYGKVPQTAIPNFENEKNG